QLTMTSESSVMNRLNGSEFSFAGQPVDINFEYDKHNRPTLHHGSFDVQPTPFSTWTLRIHNKEKLDLGGLSAVRIEVTGRARSMAAQETRKKSFDLSAKKTGDLLKLSPKVWTEINRFVFLIAFDIYQPGATGAYLELIKQFNKLDSYPKLYQACRRWGDVTF